MTRDQREPAVRWIKGDAAIAALPGSVVRTHARQLTVIADFGSAMKESGSASQRKSKILRFTFETWVRAIHSDVLARVPQIDFAFDRELAVWRDAKTSVAIKRIAWNAADLVTFVRCDDRIAWEDRRYHPMHGPRRYSVDELTRQFLPDLIVNALAYEISM